MEGTLLQREAASSKQEQSTQPESQPITLHYRNYDIFEANTITLHLQNESDSTQTTTKQIHLKPGEYTTELAQIDAPIAAIRASLDARNESDVSLDTGTDHVVLVECGNGVVDINTTESLPYHAHQSTAK